MRKLLIASGNQGKIKEISKYLADTGLEIIDLKCFPSLRDVVEDGRSFTENALKKARKRAEETGLLTLADDSGLEVNYLNGRPGILSARYAGPDAADEENNQRLLHELENVPLKKRTARYRVVLVLVDPQNGEEIITEGVCKGVILSDFRGENGFGYDPLFLPSGYNMTMAELPLEVKNKISHRAKALIKMKKVIINRYKEQ